MQITGQAWNGTVGGVVSIEVLNTTTITTPGTINTNGLGFRGGVEDYAASGFGTWNVALTNTDGGGVKAKAFWFQCKYDVLGGRYSYGAVANGGGSGNNHNAGGGGGANAGTITNWNNGIGVPNLFIILLGILKFHLFQDK